MKLNFNLSEHFSMAEALHTNVKDGIISNINHFQKNQTVLLPKLQQLAAILERIRATVCVPIYVTSFLRSFYTNAMVGGVSNSLHLSGRAVDFSLHNIPDVDKLKLYLQSLLQSQTINYFYINTVKNFCHIQI